MPFAPKIRKDILQALEGTIIPQLRQQVVTQVFVGVPFDTSNLRCRIEQQEPLPNHDKGPLQVIRKWPELGLVASRGLNISFLYEGRMHPKAGFDVSMAKMHEVQGGTSPLAGIYVLELTAPTVSLYSNYVAREDGGWYEARKDDCSKTLSLHMDAEGFSVFHSSRENGELASSHHLTIEDPLLMQLGHVYSQELQQRISLEGAQALLLTIALRLHHNLLHSKPVVSNSCWLTPIDKSDKPFTLTEIRHHQLCQDVVDYVQNHIHESLTIESIANRFDVSAFHLNRVFRQVKGTTVIHFVTDLRITVAKDILTVTQERIADVASLTGFAGTESFCTVFRRYTGMTPTQYRRRHYKAPPHRGPDALLTARQLPVTNSDTAIEYAK